jgi:hypothetical protein
MFALFLSRLPALHDGYIVEASRIGRSTAKLSSNLRTKMTPLALLQTTGILKDVYESANTH